MGNAYLEILSRREERVGSLLASNQPSAKIAAILKISVESVRECAESIIKKRRVRSRLDLALELYPKERASWQKLMDATTLWRHSKSMVPYNSLAIETLSPREREVALLDQQGKSNKEIAEILDISEITVKTHNGRIFNKLGIGNRLELAMDAFFESPLIGPFSSTTTNTSSRERFGSRIELAMDAFFESPLINPFSPVITKISSREIDVLGQLIQGKTNEEIGAALSISSETVKAHLYSVNSKIGATTLAQGDGDDAYRVPLAMAWRTVMVECADRQTRELYPREWNLTFRESDVINLIVAGQSNKEIAQQLHTTVDGVKNSLASIYPKAGVEDRVELAQKARQYVSSENRETSGWSLPKPLTNLQISIIAMIADSMSNLQIAGRTGLTEMGVKNRVRVICNLTGADSRLHLAKIYREEIEPRLAEGTLEIAPKSRERKTYTRSPKPKTTEIFDNLGQMPERHDPSLEYAHLAAIA